MENELIEQLICPDCGATMRLVAGSASVHYCKHCIRFRVKEHMEKYIESVKTIRAKFKRLPDEPLAHTS